jgi:hypothetical protein
MEAPIIKNDKLWFVVGCPLAVRQIAEKVAD